MAEEAKTITLGTVEEALAALQSGRPVLVADSPDRENEADVVLAANSVTEEWVAWTIRHSSGYLCAPMPAERADALDLPLMVPQSQDPRRTAYTVTVDAAKGVTTGISAADRAQTLRTLADLTAGPESIIRPGHVLPLRAVPGGVLHRAGHTEAAVDLVRLAGLGEVAGIAELVNDSGTMMRLPDVAELAAEHHLTLITIAQLIAWRQVNDPALMVANPVVAAPRVQAASVAQMPTEHGDFIIHSYRDLRTGAEHVALVSKQPPTGAPLVRVHSECLTGDAFASLRCDCGPQLHVAMKQVNERGGAVIYLRGHEGRGIGLLDKIHAYELQDAGRDTIEANLDLGWPADRREYGAAVAILEELGWSSVQLLTNNPTKVTALRASGIAVEQVLPLEVGHSPHNHRYLLTKKIGFGHTLETVSETDTIETDTIETVTIETAKIENEEKN